MKLPLRLRRTGSVLFAAVLLLLFLAAQVFASTEVGTGKQGSITLYESGAGTGASLSGIRFTVYRVADLLESGSYRLTDEFSGSGLRLDRLKTASEVSVASKSLTDYVSAHHIAGVSRATDSSGNVKFPDLVLGYYLVVQDVSAGTRACVICDPFLIPVPMKSENGKRWIYHLVANTKSEPASGAVLLEKKSDSGSLLSGAVFRLEKKVYGTSSGSQTGSDSGRADDWKTMISELTTNRYGQIMVKDMPYGQYRFQEVAAPSGYELDATPYPFSVSAAGSATLANGRYVRAYGTVVSLVAYDSPTGSPPSHHHPHDPPSTVSEPPPSASSEEPPTVVSDNPVPKAPPEVTEESEEPAGTETIQDQQVPKSGFNLPKTGGSICYAVCTYGGIFLAVCGMIVFLLSRRKKE